MTVDYSSIETFFCQSKCKICWCVQRVFDEGCIATVNSAKWSTSGKESDPSDQNVLNEKTDSTCLVESTTGIFRLHFSQITVVRVGRLAISMSKGSSNRTKKTWPVHTNSVLNIIHICTLFLLEQRNIYSLHSSINHLYRFENSI